MVPVSVSVPLPSLLRPAVPAMMELILSAALLTVMVGVVPSRVMVPPERRMAPEALPKVRLLALTVPETVIVPAASPSVSVPKKRASLVVVVMLPPGAVSPVKSVLHRSTVGAVQVLPAVPKPLVVPSSSQ